MDANKIEQNIHLLVGKSRIENTDRFLNRFPTGDTVNCMKLYPRVLTSCIKAVLGQSSPLAVSLVVTQRCSAACVYCDNQNQQGAHPSTQELSDTISWIADSGAKWLLLTGGEPMLQADIGHLIDHGTRLGLSVSLNTNGYQIPKSIDKLQSLSQMTVSLDGPKAFHDILRGQGSYDLAIAAINAAQKSNIPVAATAVVRRGTIEILDDLLAIASQSHISVFFQPMILQNKSANAFALYAEDKNAVFTKIRQARKSGAPVGNGAYSLSYFAGQRKMPTCRGGNVFCRIEPDDRLYICGDFRGSTIKIDFHKSLSELMNDLDPSKCSQCNCASHVTLNGAFDFHLSAIFEALKLVSK
jgi:MoaA/NifB/PqqE/SkfB family radical SAM enzyme